MFVCERPGFDARATRHSSRSVHQIRVYCCRRTAEDSTIAVVNVAAWPVLPSHRLLVAGESSEAVLGPHADHATPGPSALVLRHACVGVTRGRVPRHGRKVAAAPGPGCDNSGGARGTMSASVTHSEVPLRYEGDRTERTRAEWGSATVVADRRYPPVYMGTH